MTDSSETFAGVARGLKVTQHGAGRPLLLLHGGGGPATLARFATDVADNFHVLLPTHPGFDGTERPDAVESVGDLAAVYGEYMAQAGLKDVILMGFSLGGWLAAELALRYPQHVAGLILVDGVGIAVEGHPLLNVNGLAPGDIASYSYHETERFRIDPSTMSPEARAAMQANFATLAVYAGDHYMQDPSLNERLAALSVPALVVWGESDRVADTDYGRAYAASIPGALFQLLPRCGHLPQLEQPALLKSSLEAFARRIP